jgi:Escherichia/Staphylococcus phage prohead protease
VQRTPDSGDVPFRFEVGMTTPRTSGPALAARNSAPHFIACAFRDVKASGSPDSTMTFNGYGACFSNVDSVGDSIAPGAFKATIRAAKKSGIWPSLLAQHGGWGLTSQDLTPIGLYDEMDEDDVGLKLHGILADTERGREMHTLLTMSPRPAIDGLSIGYYPREWKFTTNPKEGEPRRTLTRVDLIEVSLVTFPANTRARVTDAKSRLTSIRQLEAGMRLIGLSAREAKRAASAAWPAIKPEAKASNEIIGALAALSARFATDKS